MCGPFTEMMPWPELIPLYRLKDRWFGRNVLGRYNIAPTQTVPFIHHDSDGQQVLKEGRWWLVPHWAKEMNVRQQPPDFGTPGFKLSDRIFAGRRGYDLVSCL